MAKRILMLSDADSFWTKRYIEYLLLPAGYEVVIFPIWGYKGTWADFYEQKGISVYRDTHRLPVIRRIPRLRMWARVAANAQSLKKLGPFDVIHNHYLSQRDLALGDRLHKAFPVASWVCSFWGSDLLRITDKQHGQMRPYLERADAVTIHSATQFEIVRTHYGEAVEEKTALVYFGQMGYKDISDLRSVADRSACKAHFGIDPTRKVVCVGSSASPAQNQDKVLRALKGLSAEMHSQLTVVLQMTYSATSPAYIDAVKEAAAALPCETVFLTQFMDAEESAYLRLAADVFIMAIQTDAFSASLQEYLFAGAQVLRGAWLPYPQLDALGIETFPFSDCAEIPDLLTKALAQPLSSEQWAGRQQLKALYSWPAVSDGWLKLYD